MTERKRDGEKGERLHWYDPTKGFGGRIGRTAKESQPAWPRVPMAPKGAPNVLIIVLDDVGFAQLGCYGGLGARIKTPHIDQLAANGIRYNNWHTTAVGCATRAALLTGRNHHSVGIGAITQFATGYPGYNGRIPNETAMIPAVLVEHGYNTFCVGKWGLAPDEDISDSGPFDRWPVGRGFERYYGFLSGETDQWHPDLWRENTRIEPPATPESGYHLTADLTDRAIGYINMQKAMTPDKPFFMYLAYGACHAPHQPPKEYMDCYREKFNAGWDAAREETLLKQKQLGIVTKDTVLPERNAGVAAWSTLSGTERKVFSRQMECFAGFLEHVDEHVGRLVNKLAIMGQLDNTLIAILSDSGASGEGTPDGMANAMNYFNMVPETLEDKLELLDQWGQPGTHPHYAVGWAMAGNTPHRWYKHYVFEGGARSPLIFHWPAAKLEKGAIRTQFHHVVDIYPTLLELIGIEMPKAVKGYQQRPLEGVSMAYSFKDAKAKTPKATQYFEMAGHRALWQEGWKAVACHWTDEANRLYGRTGPALDGQFPDTEWELYYMDSDFSESKNLAVEEPARLKKMISTWWGEAERYRVLPLDDSEADRLIAAKPLMLKARDKYDFYAPMKIARSASPDVRRRSHTITAEVEIPEGGAEGCIVSNGGPDGGYTLFIKDGKANYVSNFIGREYFKVISDKVTPEGKLTLRFDFRKTGSISGHGTLYLNEKKVGETNIERTNPVVYAAGEGLEIGGDSVAAVSPDYRSPFTFTGKIIKVQIAVGSDQVVDPRAEARIAKYRQ